jgi:hypothetical protein
MNEITKAKITDLFNAMQKTMELLWGRWQDEKQYEDFQDYINHCSTVFETMKGATKTNNAVFVQMSKRPFAILFDFEGWQVQFKITSKQYSWRATTIKQTA